MFLKKVAKRAAPVVENSIRLYKKIKIELKICPDFLENPKPRDLS